MTGVNAVLSFIVIELSRVTKIYPSAPRESLRNVSLSIARGEFVFLVGDSGAGKTTMLKLMRRDTLPTSGRIFVNGRDLVRMQRWRVPAFRRSIGSVLDDLWLLPTRTAYENVAYALEVIGKSRGVARRVVPELLEFTFLVGREHKYPFELSDGEQQRLALARALVNRPLIVLADQPTVRLNLDEAIDLLRVLDRINRTGTTVVVATHDPEVVNAMRRRVVELREGKIVRDQERGVYI